MNPQRHDRFYGEAAELGGLKSELANLSTFNERKYFHLSVSQCEVAVKSFLGFILEEIPGVMTMLSRSSASLTPESKAVASSSIVRDAFHLYIRLAHELLQSNPDNPNENDLAFQRSRRNDPRCNKSRRR